MVDKEAHESGCHAWQAWNQGRFVNALLWLSGNALPIAQKAQIGQHAGHERAHRRGPCPVFSSVMLEKD
jgi:hypothetical protein